MCVVALKVVNRYAVNLVSKPHAVIHDAQRAQSPDQTKQPLFFLLYLELDGLQENTIYLFYSNTTILCCTYYCHEKRKIRKEKDRHFFENKYILIDQHKTIETVIWLTKRSVLVSGPLSK